MPVASLLIAAALLVPAGDVPSCPPAQIPVACADLSHRNGLERADGEFALLIDASDGQLDELTLLEAALLAGGSTDAEFADMATRFHAECKRLRSATPDGESEREAAQRIFESLHERVFTGRYQARCSDCAVALEHGDYNCVTATLLYVEALRINGIQAEPYAMVGHVFCRVGKEQFDVETTCPRWFRLSHDEASRAARRAAPRAHARAAARKLNDVELIAKIYYNRGVACFRRGEFEQGLKLTKRSLTFDPHDEVARGNIMAGLNNWGLDLCGRRQFPQAQQKFEKLRNLDPDYPTLEENVAHLYRLWGKSRLQHVRASDSQLVPPQG